MLDSLDESKVVRRTCMYWLCDKLQKAHGHKLCAVLWGNTYVACDAHVVTHHFEQVTSKA